MRNCALWNPAMAPKEFTMKRTHLSLYYLFSYLILAGLALIIASAIYTSKPSIER